MNYVVRIGEDNRYRILQAVEAFHEAATATLEHQRTYGGAVFMRDGSTGRRYSVRGLLDATAPVGEGSDG